MGIPVEIPALAEGPHPLKAAWRTDARGRVRIAGVARGSYKVRVIPGGGSSPVEATVPAPGIGPGCRKRGSAFQERRVCHSATRGT